MRRRVPLLFLTVLVIATAGLVYELLAGAQASHVLGDSVTQFSTTIGVYLFAMGIGAYASRFIDDRLSQRFVEIELATALVGGLEGPALFLAYGEADLFRVVLYAVVALVGILVGLEVPLLVRILERDLELKELIARVLTFDYLGALVGSLLFALVLVPKLHMERISVLFGLLNCAVGILSTWVLADTIYARVRARLRVQGAILAVALCAVLVWADRIQLYGEQAMFADPILYVDQTEYQRIVLTNGAGGAQLFLNGHLQFSSIDEYRYHEALVHPAFAVATRRRDVLVLGGGDGLALREILRYPDVAHVTLVDLDRGVTEMARRLPAIRGLNHGSLDDRRVRVVHDDAMVWLDERARGPFDVVIVDFPDPNNFSVGKLYTQRFYTLLTRAMHDGTAVVIQATSPLFARRSFWCIERTMAAAGLFTKPYHALVPSFGEWGYVLAMRRPFDAPRAPALRNLRYLDAHILPTLFVFSADMARTPVEVNRLNRQVLVHYYAEEWSRYEG